MLFRSFLKKNNYLKWILFLAFITFILHGAVLFDHGIHWDDWVFYRYTLLDTGASLLKHLQYSMGRPLELPLRLFFLKLGLFSFYPAWNLICLFVSAVLLFYLLLYCNIKKNLAGMAAVVFLLAPGSTLTGFVCVSSYYTSYMFFFVAVYTALLAFNTVGFRGVKNILVSWIFFTLSFSLASLLVLFYVFLPVYFIFGSTSRQRKYLLLVAFIFLPLFYWFVTRHYFPVFDAYEGYNQIIFSISAAMRAASKSMLQVSSLIFLLMIFMVFLLIFKAWPWEAVRKASKRSKAILFWSLLLYVSVIFPYAITGNHSDHRLLFTHEIYSSRHLLFVPLFFSIFAVGLCHCYQDIGSPINMKAFRIKLVSISFILMGLIYWVTVYSAWLGQTALQNAMIWFLQQNKSLCHTDVFLVKNNFSRGYLNPPFRYYALSGMLTDACEGKQVIGLSLSRNVEYNALRIRGLSKHHNHSLQINGFVSPVDWHKMSVLTLTPRFSTENASLIGLAYLKSRMTNKTHEFYKNLVHFVVSNRYDADIADAKYNILGDNR